MLKEGFSMLYGATDGAIAVYDQPKIRNFANYIRKLFIAKNYVVNFADGAARCNPAAELLYTAGIRMEDDALADFGAYCFVWQTNQGIFAPHSLNRAMMTLCRAEEMRCRQKAVPSFESSCVLENLGILVSREQSDLEKGFFLCAKAGANGDSHNHNDVGNFVVYWNGEPVVVDVGVEVYRRNFFSSDRYKIWTMQSQYHNLPTINGVMQHEGGSYCARDVAFSLGQTDAITMDIAGAYPAQAGAARYVRRAELDREKKQVRITDRWELHKAEALEMHFMTPHRPRITDTGLLISVGGGTVAIIYDTACWIPEIETRHLTDAKLTASWGSEMNRVTLKYQGLQTEGTSVFTICEAAQGG